jgi:hypothetical protein
VTNTVFQAKTCQKFCRNSSRYKVHKILYYRHTILQRPTNRLLLCREVQIYTPPHTSHTCQHNYKHSNNNSRYSNHNIISSYNYSLQQVNPYTMLRQYLFKYKIKWANHIQQRNTLPLVALKRSLTMMETSSTLAHIQMATASRLIAFRLASLWPTSIKYCSLTTNLTTSTTSKCSFRAWV